MSDNSILSDGNQDNWGLTTLGKVADFINGDRGKNYPSPLDRVKVGVPFINTGHIEPNGHLSNERMDYISRERFDLLGSGKVKCGDIVYCLRGSTIGKLARNHYKEGAIASSLAIVRAKPNADQDFLYYFLASPRGQALAKEHDNGSAQPNLSAKSLGNYPLQLPPLIEQKSIAHILGTLDDKIELNRRMNETLEAMAQALFKSWFVDFDPVIDKALAAGNPIPKPFQKRAEVRRALGDKRKPLPEEIQKQFPSQFVFTEEMGWIPEGWEVTTIGNEFDVTMGQSPPGNTYNENGEGIPFFQGRADFGFRYPSNRVYCTTPKRMAAKGDTLVSVRAPVGDVNMAADACCIGRGVSASRHKSGSRSYTYYSMLQLREHFKVYEAEGTVFGSINKRDFNELPQLAFASNLVESYERYAGPMDQKISNNTQVINMVSQFRDTLLPKLISGELRIQNLDRLLDRLVEKELYD